MLNKLFYFIAQSKPTNQRRFLILKSLNIFKLNKIGSRNNNRRRSRTRSPVRHPSPISNRNGEYLIKMRGMPFNVVEGDIREVEFIQKKSGE